MTVAAFDIAWALLKSDDFYEAFEDHNEFMPSITRELQARKQKEFRDSFQPPSRGEPGYKRPIDVYRERFQPQGKIHPHVFQRFLMDYYMNPPATERRRTARTVQEIMDDRDSYYV